MEVVGGNRGYSALMREILDHAVGPDMKEAFNVGLDLSPDDPEILAGKPFRALNAWPDLAGFRDTMLAYFDACTKLGLSLHRAFSADLGVPLDYFEDKFDRSTAIVRLLHYPAAKEADQVGAGAHTDYGNITLLATDDVGGLEVRDRSGAWIEAPPMPGAFVVNIGDCLMRWTNDVYVSTPHRVFNRSGRERYSIAFFFDPNPEAAVVAIPSCVRRREPPICAGAGGRLSDLPARSERAGLRPARPLATDASSSPAAHSLGLRLEIRRPEDAPHDLRQHHRRNAWARRRHPAQPSAGPERALGEP